MDFIRGQNTPYWVWLWILKYDFGPFARRNGAPNRLIPIGANRPPRRPCNLNLGFWMFSVSPIFFFIDITRFSTVHLRFGRKYLKKYASEVWNFASGSYFVLFFWTLRLVEDLSLVSVSKSSPAAFGVINPTDPLQMQDMARQVASADWS